MKPRALYTLMRMNWLLDPTLPAEPWQVEDYRALSTEELFERMRAHDLHLERSSFLALAEEVDSPEELSDMFLADVEADVITQDQVYLLVFELWRRLITDKPCLSIFCDELDHQIYLYDHAKSENNESIQDAIANLQVILDENSDSGVDPHEVFSSIGSCCANDIESFIYDYISEQVDSGNEVYANELLDGFIDYIADVKWFDFLRARLLSLTDPEATHELIKQLITHYVDENDLEFDLELLSFMVHGGEKELFHNLVKKIIPLITTEDEFHDLLTICADFYHCLDNEKKEEAVQKILTKRMHLHMDGNVNQNDPHLAELLAIIS